MSSAVKSNGGVLDKSIAYLGGPIDFHPDLGVGYRQSIIEESKAKGLNIKFLDPTNKITGLTADVGEEQTRIRKYKKKGKWKHLTSLMQKIVRTDLRQVDLSDFILVMVDTSVHMCGTYHELILADLQKKPVLAIIKGGKSNAPAWLFGIIDHNLMFDSEGDCIDYLVKVNNGKVKLDDRWVLFRKELNKEEEEEEE